MYHLVLTRRYLTTKILPFLATLAVLLSTATVIIAWSIMTGFLGVLLNSGRSLVGDVIITWPSAGFGYYEELVADLEADPAVKAATPVIEVMGLIKLPDNRQLLARVRGVDFESFARVTTYAESVWWRPLDEPLRKDKEGRDPRLVDVAGFVKGTLATMGERARSAARALVEAAKQRGVADTAVTELAALGERVGALEATGRAAVGLKANSPERREATKAFFIEAEEAVEGLRTTLETLRAAGMGEEAKGTAEAVTALREELRPIYERYMNLAVAYDNGAALKVVENGARVPAMVWGVEFTNFNERKPEGYYELKQGLRVRRSDGSLDWLDGRMVGREMTLNLLPLDSSPTKFDLVSKSIPVANEMRTGLFEFDKSWVLVDLKTVQRMVRMEGAQEVVGGGPYAVVPTPEGPRFAPPRVVGTTPARVTNVMVRGSGALELPALRKRCEEIYGRFEQRHQGEVPSASLMYVTTWEEDQATLVGAVKKEIVMVLLILGVVSLTVSFLILAIFWAIVREKTKDIGILRAVGASRLSVCGLWLEYALITGLLGSVLGGLAGCLVVWNINPIHDWLGRNLGLVIWDPRIYYFFEIPNKVDPQRALLVMAAGTGFAVLGALIPAVRAAFMDPVKSLRFE